MAEPGDPRKPEDDFDDQIGFCSPRSIAGQSVGPRDEPLLEPQPEPIASFDEVGGHSGDDAETPAVQATAQQIEEPMFNSEPPAVAPEAEPEAAPVFVSRAERRQALAAEPTDRLTWALTLYALILFAVPTLGFSAIIGLLAVTGRTVNASPFLMSHYVFQQRTLWIAAIAALVGLILIVVNLGVFVLFLLAIWTLVRGAAGLWRLKNGQPIYNPYSWFL